MFWITQGYTDQKEFGAEGLKFCNSKECWIMLSVAVVVVVVVFSLYNYYIMSLFSDPV